MIDPFTLLAFLPVALLIGAIPGPDMAYCAGQGARGGAGAALWAAAGLAMGALAGLSLAGFGLAEMAAHSPGALAVAKWIGAGFLAWLAMRSLRGRRQTRARARPRAGRSLAAGALVSLTNPKGAGLALGVVPQFVDPAQALLPQFLVLGAVLALSGFCCNSLAGVAAARMRHRIGANPTLRRIGDILTAGLFGALALRLVLKETP